MFAPRAWKRNPVNILSICHSVWKLRLLVSSYRYFYYLIDTTRVDDEDKLLCETTRITIVNNDIVAFRGPAIEMMILLTKMSLSSDTVAQTTTGERIPHTSVNRYAAFVRHSHPYDEETLSGTAASDHTTSPNHDISDRHCDPSLTRCATERSSSYNLRKRVTFGITSDRERKLRKTSNVNTRGYVASQVEEAKFFGITEPTSTLTMVERNEFYIDFVPTTKNKLWRMKTQCNGNKRSTKICTQSRWIMCFL